MKATADVYVKLFVLILVRVKSVVYAVIDVLMLSVL